MVTSMEEYMSLRREFLKVSKIHVKRDAVEELKVFYKDAINSARTLDRVEDMEGLLKILEKRGVVRYDLVTPLKHIARKYLHGLGINNRLDSYEANVKSQSSPYPAHTNLYQYGNGEFFPPDEILNRLSSTRNVYPRSRVDDLSDCNNFAIPVTPYGSEVPSLIDPRDNIDNINVERKDFNVPCYIRENDLEILIDKVVSRVSIPPATLNVESQGDKQSTIEDLDKSEEPPETRLLATPQSGELQNPVCFSVINNSSKKKNLQRDIRIFFQRKYVRISLIVLPVAIILSLIIVYGLLNNSVHYIPQPSAPSSSRPTEAPSSQYPGFTTYAARQPAYNLPQLPATSTSLQTLSPREAQLQQHGKSLQTLFLSSLNSQLTQLKIYSIQKSQ